RKVVKSTVGVSDKFRVTVHRQNKAYPMTSMKLQAELGAVVKEEIPSAIVSLKNFIHNLEIEIHRDFALIFTNRVAGPGGMPEGVEGKALALFSGGIDSPVAAWMLGKRGVSIDFLFMNPLGPILENKVNSVYASIKAWFPNSKLYVIDTSEALKQIRENIQEGERQVILKRFLYKLAEKIANRKQYDALVTGESIGQASSQTMQSITVLNEAVTLPVLRPLIGMDKEETIHLARKIGSYESSSKIAEFCSIESHSNAHPRLENILKLERGLGIDYDEVASKLKLSEKTEVESMAPSGDLHDFEIIYLLKTPKYNLKKGKKYLFVCRAAHSASEAAHKARLQGVDAFALSYKDAKKKGLKV
ncbi:MAG: hypothetical protein GOV00_00545, partial [Candidatus Altiarchaeota archaeon]|nr:hypothetical protein [Candidatus Altiarchaeota archaeon]